MLILKVISGVFLIGLAYLTAMWLTDDHDDFDQGNDHANFV